MTPAAATVGDLLPERTFVPTVTQVFRYSAVTWNGHRIHYDRPYAEAEGYPDVLVQSHLHGAFVARFCQDWIAGHGELRRLSVAVQRFAVPGDELTCRGEVVAREGSLLTVDVTESKPGADTPCVRGTAVFELGA